MECCILNLNMIFQVLFYLVFSALLLIGAVVELKQHNMPSAGLSSYGLFHLGSKTNYRRVLKDNYPSVYPIPRPKAPWSKICKPVHISLFSRHGHRDLGLKYLKNVKMFSAKFQSKYRKASGAKWFLDYKLPYDFTDAKLLTTVGWIDNIDFGKRVARTWPEVFKDVNAGASFFTSDRPRTYNSARAFIKGFGSALGREGTTFDLEIDNLKTRFLDYCNKYQVAVVNNKTAFAESMTFLRGPEIGKVVNNVKQRLGLGKYKDTMIDKDPKVLRHLFHMCQADLAANITRPIWCYLFTDSDALPLEYYLDLEDYFESSYGFEINSKMTCPLVKYILEKMDGAIQGIQNGESYDRGVFGFGHSETLIPLCTALGLFKPETPLTASNYAAQANRTFRTSNIAPFNGNIELVLHECETSKTSRERLTGQERRRLPHNMERFMLEVYSNEKRTRFPICTSELCPYSKVRHSLQEFLTCDLQRICNVGWQVTSSFSRTQRFLHFVYALVLVTVLIFLMRSRYTYRTLQSCITFVGSICVRLRHKQADAIGII